MKIHDEMMEQVSGGSITESEPQKFQVGDPVKLKFANEQGDVTVIIGAVIDVRNTPGGWMYKVRYEANGTVYEHRYPEFALEAA
ncbi:MAG: hypothetical protein IKE28_02445 [Solobacterium sp.]|nr:hypothetical protein [Solobacterium sp.]